MIKTKGIQDWFRKDEKYIPENHWLRRHGYRKDGRVFNRFLSGHEADYISCMHKEIAGHRQDIINMKKIKIDDIETYSEWKATQIKELQTEIDNVRWYGLTNGCS